MNIAIIGTGISGLTAAHLLHPAHSLTLFESNSYIGGHTNTVSVNSNGHRYAVDTGFIVFNERNYPNFTKLLKQLDVATQPAPMSFSVTCEQTGIEYGSRSLNAFFGQRRNLLRVEHYRMLRDILRFYREAPELLENPSDRRTLGEYLRDSEYSTAFIDRHILPLAGAIWSSSSDAVAEGPASSLVRFFFNHGMLSLRDQPQWRVIQGGSREYVEALIGPFKDRIRLNTGVGSVTRQQDHVSIKTSEGEVTRFDAVVMATHADQSLRMLTDPSEMERRVLGSFPYQHNKVILHTDQTRLPSRRRLWSSWNHRIPKVRRDVVDVTYNMSILQSLNAADPFCVSLNSTEKIPESRILRRLEYEHPLQTQDSVGARDLHDEINGANRTYFCGAYWGHGFHEDGVKSAIAACRGLIGSSS